MKIKVSIFWFRRDLRLKDNTALYNALKSGFPVIPIFIFDQDILNELEIDDARVNFIYDSLEQVNNLLSTHDSSLRVFKSSITQVWENILDEYDIQDVYVNEDYEPYGLERDRLVSSILNQKKVKFNSFIDHVIFKPGEIVKENNSPYTVYTPFKNKWLKHFTANPICLLPKANYTNFAKLIFHFPTLSDLNFLPSKIKVQKINLASIDDYSVMRDFPALNGTSYLGPHLRFGTVSIRSIISELKPSNAIFLSELIWREFFIQILVYYPHVITDNFKSNYNGIVWLNNEDEFKLWCKGETGYPIVDAGMRQLNQTGYMHNRVRMITASFLCKHLLIDWRWGEAYFAQKLLDYELASNNGNWQWVAGTGCDSAPYFRVFSPSAQTLKFDSELKYITHWVPELNEINYTPIIDHKFARQRVLNAYKTGLENNTK